VAFGLIAALLTSTLLAVAVVTFGRRIGVVDIPDGSLKPHAGTPVPLGGVCVMGGLHIGLLVAGGFSWPLFTATAIVFVIGLADDMVGLSPITRLVGAGVAGITLALMTPEVDGVAATILVVGLVVVLINAINLFDGLDALASTVGALAAAGIGFLSFLRLVDAPWLPAIIAAALVGVLVLNWPPARLYLGDNGAYVLGTSLAWAVVHASAGPTQGLIAAALVGMPLLDLVVTVGRRARRGVALFGGDRDHTYDVLHRGIRSVWKVVLLFALAQVAWMGALIGFEVAWGEAAAIVAAVVLGLLVVVAWSATSQNVGRFG
jgi:UDP-GlcNAc:undecaprenyl-phosphate GlcNAc-1-phosphate transferase